MRSHHRPCRVVPRHIQIAAAGTGQVQVAWEPGSLARPVRGSPKIRAPNQRRPAPTRIESLNPPPPPSSLIPTPASRLPVAKARAKLLRLLQLCVVAAKPVSADPSLFCFPRSRPLFRRILSFPFPFLSPPQPHWTQFPSRHQKENSPRPLSSILVCLVSCCSHQLHSYHHPNARTSFLSSSPLQFARATASRPRLNPLLATSFSPQGYCKLSQPLAPPQLVCARSFRRSRRDRRRKLAAPSGRMPIAKTTARVS